MGRYIAAAMALGVSQGGEPPPEAMLGGLLQRNHAGPLPSRETPAKERLAGHEEQVARWLQEERLQLTRVHELLVRDGVAISYTTLRRYVREAGLWKRAQSTVRMALWPPGEVAEIDFGTTSATWKTAGSRPNAGVARLPGCAFTARHASSRVRSIATPLDSPVALSFLARITFP